MFAPFSVHTPAVISRTLVPNHRFCVTETRQRYIHLLLLVYFASSLCILVQLQSSEVRDER